MIVSKICTFRIQFIFKKNKYIALRWKAGKLHKDYICRIQTTDQWRINSWNIPQKPISIMKYTCVFNDKLSLDVFLCGTHQSDQGCVFLSLTWWQPFWNQGFVYFIPQEVKPSLPLLSLHRYIHVSWTIIKISNIHNAL